jgi:hypothetical protein
LKVQIQFVATNPKLQGKSQRGTKSGLEKKKKLPDLEIASKV